MREGTHKLSNRLNKYSWKNQTWYKLEHLSQSVEIFMDNFMIYWRYFRSVGNYLYFYIDFRIRIICSWVTMLIGGFIVWRLFYMFLFWKLSIEVGLLFWGEIIKIGKLTDCTGFMMSVLKSMEHSQYGNFLLKFLCICHSQLSFRMKFLVSMEDCLLKSSN